MLGVFDREGLTVRLRRAVLVATALVGVVAAALPFTLVGPTAAVAAPSVPGPIPTQSVPNFGNCPINDVPPQQSPQLSWPQTRLKYQEAWRYSTGRGVTVAVIDTGVDANHPQLRGHVLDGYDVATTGSPTGNAIQDCEGHGTFVAGIIAAHKVNENGFVGIAPDVTILPIRQTWGKEGGQPKALAVAIGLAVDQGADIINISLTTAGAQPYLLEAIRYAAQHNVLIVAATGNTDGQSQGANAQGVLWPARYSHTPEGEGNVIAVTGTTRQDEIGKQARFGPQVDVAAPGDQVISLRAHTKGGRPGLTIGDGTSFATPFVSGLAALIKSYYGKNMTPAQIKARIEQTTDRPSTNLPSTQFGWGLINPVNALTAVLPREGNTGAAPVAQPLGPVPQPEVVDTATRNRALAIFGGALLLAIVVVTAALVIPRGRQHGWRSARREEREAEASTAAG